MSILSQPRKKIFWVEKGGENGQKLILVIMKKL